MHYTRRGGKTLSAGRPRRMVNHTSWIPPLPQNDVTTTRKTRDSPRGKPSLGLTSLTRINKGSGSSPTTSETLSGRVTALSGITGILTLNGRRCRRYHMFGVMTLNKGDKLRNMDKRRGSMPFPLHLQNLHRRSMPVDDRELRSTTEAQPTELSSLMRFSPAEEHRNSCVSDSSDSVISSGSDSDAQVYKVVLLGSIMQNLANMD
ncbi:uncharacterized protein [Sinocyclocheilus grahami]|uniref:uncharacterized protein n=1 Tax=Sinocyclocheilus grahami TaxID=75366 RepID=UPI0007AD50BA|nr:PREDICTED: uncharacterized protein LOC107564165 [Sinocyclocheilus grahami]